VLVLAQVGGLKPAQLRMPHVLLSFPVLFDSSRTLGRALFSGLLGPSVPIRCTLTEANPISESFFVDHCQSLPSTDRRYRLMHDVVHSLLRKFEECFRCQYVLWSIDCVNSLGEHAVLINAEKATDYRRFESSPM
jgi:hypothetical protein